MKKPVLVIMAAGMGSRYGGLKQIDPIDKEGHIIMDFSLKSVSFLLLKRKTRRTLKKQSENGLRK